MPLNDLTKKSIAKWEDVPNDGLLDTFTKLNNIDSEFLQLSEQEVIILPDNTRYPEVSKDCNVFLDMSKEVLIALKEGGLEARLYDDGREKRTLKLAFADIILPTLLFLGKAAVTVGLGILGKLIYDHWIRPSGREPPSIKLEYLEIDQDRNIVQYRSIEGSTKEVQRVLMEESQIAEKEFEKHR